MPTEKLQIRLSSSLTKPYPVILALKTQLANITDQKLLPIKILWVKPSSKASWLIECPYQRWGPSRQHHTQASLVSWNLEGIFPPSKNTSEQSPKIRPLAYNNIFPWTIRWFCEVLWPIWESGALFAKGDSSSQTLNCFPDITGIC